MKPLNVADYRLAAKRRLPRGMFEYIDRGTEDEVGLRGIRTALDMTRLNQHVLNDVSVPDTSTVIFGEKLPLPVIISPTAVAGLVWHDGEVQLARAARAAGIPFCVATQSMTSMEDIAAGAAGANLWFQLYVFEDRGLTRDLLRRAKALGIRNLLFTADTPRSPKKEWNTRNGFGIPIKPSLAGGLDLLAHPRWSLAVMLRYVMTTGVPTYAHYPPAYRTSVTRAAVWDNVKLARRLTWDDFAEVRREWDGNLILKGVLSPDDAERALSLGADGVVVSCHGGRNLDSAPMALDALPRIADAVGGRMTILADSGVRRGSDIVKYIASGADAVLVGRAPLYGTAAGGEKGAKAVIDILREELDHCMAFTGRSRLSEITREAIWRP
ncbi:alpha-hydroxy acid oxidase [Shinella zoogloeoides]|jgi:(S)-mandelate dehydrogenase|uniref:alpha-hydroxy acid oxidase n=1 Tax=Shinella zoogloeoides TaxID=352475 RepID=UPI00273D9488|nr:alpha-hydroxy acid oxidase [Shinella zoogloeoides]WLR93254.1 alpha-hydroxy acid oxidase [Shinella zoogloeoides]